MKCRILFEGLLLEHENSDAGEGQGFCWDVDLDFMPAEGMSIWVGIGFPVKVGLVMYRRGEDRLMVLTKSLIAVNDVFDDGSREDEELCVSSRAMTIKKAESLGFLLHVADDFVTSNAMNVSAERNDSPVDDCIAGDEVKLDMTHKCYRKGCKASPVHFVYMGDGITVGSCEKHFNGGAITPDQVFY